MCNTLYFTRSLHTKAIQLFVGTVFYSLFQLLITLSDFSRRLNPENCVDEQIWEKREIWGLRNFQSKYSVIELHNYIELLLHKFAESKCC